MSDLLVTGGQILRPDMTIERADVLLDQSTGRIDAIGDVGPADDELDAAGGLVIPGLVNAHTHVAMTLLRGVADDKPLDAWLREDIWPVEAELTEADVRVGAELGLIEMIKSGTTALSDMYFDIEEIAAAVEQAGVRARLGYTAVTVGKDDEAARADVERSLEVAQEFDGAAEGRIRTTFQPHSLTTVDEASLREFVPAVNEAGLATHLHANETPDEVGPIVEAHGMRPLAYAQDIGLLARDTYVAHGVHVDDSEIELLVETDTGVAHCPASNMKLASGMAPVQDMLDAGVTVGLGTDGAASNNDLDMFDEMRDAAMLGKLAADDASAVDAASVVEMATANGAELLGFDSGRLEAGANADLAVIDLDAPHLTPAHDLLSHLAYAVRGSDVRHTVADGQVLMRDREVTVFDEEAVRREATDRAEKLVERAT
ncbi:amidohydrolase [Halorhabdus sp. CBA1104]|uniref:amidohydrolase n=1 Tax=Halorhabdus sp. CBA1104 TaxID=1380432 RepID=UPI0012B41983|nr:amidohydrolase [Halorhabdus sp. CBA1104]QGN08101.1 amidohydrolase [Halorhabdus sp. CBA1104]